MLQLVSDVNELMEMNDRLNRMLSMKSIIFDTENGWRPATNELMRMRILSK